MMVEYFMRRDKVTDETGKRIVVYGIDVVIDDEVVRSVRDVFCDAADAERFIRLCNLLELNPVHLDDAIADAIAA